MVNRRRETKISAVILKKIRTDLGLKQKDLVCDGIKNISRLENGEIEISHWNATVLCEKIKHEMKERNLTLDYEITVDLLLGKTNIITDELIQELNNNINEPESTLIKINDILIKLNIDNSINLLTNTINVLEQRIYANALFIIEYCYRLLKYNLGNRSKIDVYNSLIRSNTILSQHETIIALGKSMISSVLEFGSNEQREKFLGNLANSYFQAGQCDECYKTLKLIKKYQNIKSELQCISLSAVCRGMKGDIDGAEKIYKSVISKSEKENMNDYIINSYSNLSDLYREVDMGKALFYINKAISSITEITHKQFICNAYFNYLLICVKNSDIELSEEISKKTFKLTIELKNKDRQNKIVKIIINLYRSNNMNDKICGLLCYLKNEYNYNVPAEILMELLSELEDKELIYRIIKYYKNNI